MNRLESNINRPLTERLFQRLIGWLMRDRPSPPYPLCDFQRIKNEVKQGDVLLIEGRSRISDVIRNITQSPWTHTALYLGFLHEIENPVLRDRVKEMALYPIESNTPLIIESLLGKGTIISTLDYYRKDHIRICRPRGLGRTDMQKVIGYAIGKLGMEYDVRQILDLARFMLPLGLLPRRWCSTLFAHRIGQSTRQICSTLLAEAYGAIKYPILPLVKIDPRTGLEFIPRNPRLITPNDFDYSPYFDIIKYPMLDLSEEAAYRHLPWNTEGVLSNSHHRSHRKGDQLVQPPQPDDPKAVPPSLRQQAKGAIAALKENQSATANNAERTPEAGDAPELIDNDQKDDKDNDADAHASTEPLKKRRNILNFRKPKS